MASAVTSEKCRANVAQRTYLHDPADATVVTKIAWVDMALFESILVAAMFISGTGILTFKLFASESSTGAGSPVEVKVHADPTVADAAGDMVVLELTSDELAKLGSDAGVDLRYVSAELDCDHADDKVAVTYTRMRPKFAYSGLTGDAIA
jgi:hypothetical protein